MLSAWHGCGDACAWCSPSTKNGFSAFDLPLDEVDAAAAVSSSMVSIRFLVSGPVSSIFCRPTRPKRGSSVGSSLSVAKQWITPRGPTPGTSGFLGSQALGLLLGVEVVEVAEELIEAVHGGQKLVLVAEVVLAELAGGVARGLRISAMVSLPPAADAAPGMPTLVRPGAQAHWPVMKEERPAVQLCSA